MLPAPRIIAIDDEQKHLDGLADGLNQYGAACLKVSFTADGIDLKPCPHARVIFADLHLANGGGVGDDHAQHYAIIGGLIENDIKPAGPYLVILWTRFADKAGELQQFLLQRLHGVPKPFAVVALDKNTHLNVDGSVKDPEQLIAAIVSIVKSQPQIAALLNWEGRILEAAAVTVSAMMTLPTTIGDPAKQGTELARLLGHLAIAAVGRENVDQNHFHAVNEALLPILADHVATLKAKESDVEIWNSAYSVDAVTDLSSDEAAKLNHFVHIADEADAAKGCDRGAVIALPDTYTGEAFASTFGMTPDEASKKRFGCNDYAAGDNKFRWVLVQAEAACDFAQKQPGPLPFYLGLEMPEASLQPRKQRPEAIWASPAFELNGSQRVLCVHSRFHVSELAVAVEGAIPFYRLREQLLNDLIFHIHTHEARPGVLSFSKTKEKVVQQDSVRANPAAAAAPGTAKKTEK